jgi:hypothetical protein
LKSVFIGGSRRVLRLAPEVLARIDRIIAKSLPVLVGDANGADKAVQRYLAQRNYSAVRVFCADAAPRNNVGRWPVRVVASRSPRKDFEHYAAKDRVMAAEASVGLMLWDGESHGTLMNVMRLAAANKAVVIFLQPQSAFVEVRTKTDLAGLLAGLDAASAARLRADAAAEGLAGQADQASLGFSA